MSKELLELLQTTLRPEVRESIVKREDGTEKTVHTFDGYAIVFNEPSVVMVDWYSDKPFREYIDPGSITQDMIDKCDIVCTVGHDMHKIIARHKPDGTGTLKLTVDSIGLRCQFDFGEGPTALDAYDGVKRGDWPGMSFTFRHRDYTYTDSLGEDGIIERHIDHFTAIEEVTVAAYPAYPAASASCREAWDAMLREEPKPATDPDPQPTPEPQEPSAEEQEREARCIEHGRLSREMIIRGMIATIANMKR